MPKGLKKTGNTYPPPTFMKGMFFFVHFKVSFALALVVFFLILEAVELPNRTVGSRI